MTDPTRAADADLDDIVDAISDGDLKRAADLAVAALRSGVEHPLVLVLAAERLEAEGRAQQALDLLQRALAAAPDEAETWARFGAMLARQGSLDEALEALDAALAIDPGAYLALITAGAVSYNLGKLTSAREYYRRAAELSPDDAEILSALAVIAARLNDPGEARALAERALARRPGFLTAHVAIGRVELLEGSAALAAMRMTQLLAEPDLGDDSRVGVLDLRAEAFDASDRPAEAFADYEARNTILARLNAPRIAQASTERRVDQARRLTAYFASAPTEMWRTGAGKDSQGPQTARRHVFLLGFPRSGTTLLEKVLASHPDFITLEEVDHLAEAGNYLLASGTALEELATLTAAEAAPVRQAYWRGVRETVGEDITDRILVDKMPLHTVALPLIAKLFPDAKIFFAVRDPRDVVLSCFRRRFRVNSAMYEFLTLDGAARYYGQVMGLAKIYRALLPLHVHEVRHEAVVSDFEGQVRNALSFVGADWDPAVRDFAKHARANPRTPSDPQVARGLNADGVGQWRRYERQLAPIFDILAPWVEHYRYPQSATP